MANCKTDLPSIPWEGLWADCPYILDCGPAADEDATGLLRSAETPWDWSSRCSDPITPPTCHAWGGTTASAMSHTFYQKCLATVVRELGLKKRKCQREIKAGTPD